MNEALQVGDRKLLQAAQAAVDSGDLQRADTLFRDYLAQARLDHAGLAAYGDFCLRTDQPESACYLLYKANALEPGDAELLDQLGYAWIEVKDFDSAGQCFESVLARAPTHAAANYGLALCHVHARAWEQAADGFERALAAQPGTLPILLELAGACERSGDTQRARAAYEQAEQLAPQNPAMLLAHARFLRLHGDPSRALQCMERCARQLPDAVEVVLEKARCLLALGDGAQAMQELSGLERQTPGLPECYEEFGNCLREPSEREAREMHWCLAIDQWIKDRAFDPADALLDRLLAANPGSAIGWNLKGILREAQQRFDDAQAAYQTAIAADGSLLDAYANLATLQERTNRTDDARQVVDAGLANEATAGAMRNASIQLRLIAGKIARRRKDYGRGIAMLDAIGAMEPSAFQQQMVAFDRGLILDQLGDTTDAMVALTEGNALAATQWLERNPGENRFLASVDQTLALVREGWLKRFRPAVGRDKSRDPVFLLGFPRSGTTLLNQVLDSHSAIQTIEEEQTIAKILGAIRHMPAHHAQSVADCDAYDIAYLQKVYYRAASCFCELDPARRLVDKYPLHSTLAGMIHRVFPDARFLFALRHPCDVVLSCFMQNFQANDAMANFNTLADTVVLYTRTMDLWQAYVEQLPLVVHTVRYESVVDDFDGEIRALCDFLDVPWEDDLRRFASNALDRGKIKTSSYAQVSRPLYREGRYRWERYREHLAPYLPALRPYIDRFGYPDPAQSG